MLKQLMEHRWICLVQGGLTLALGLGLLFLRSMMTDSLTTTFVAAIALLSTGFVLLAAGLMDMAIAVDIVAREKRLVNALLWVAPGGLALVAGIAVLLTPHLTVCLLAAIAACHALLVTAADLVLIPALHGHPMQRNLFLVSSLVFVFLSALLIVGALGTQAMATSAVGLYASYFGLRLLFLGWEYSSLRTVLVSASWKE